jgi:hypothetical protein
MTIKTMTMALLAGCLLLAACGKVGAPEPPKGDKDTYPRTYPSAQ